MATENKQPENLLFYWTSF